MRDESAIQQEIFMYYQNNFCTKKEILPHFIFSVPNDGKDLKEQMRKKATGLKSGVSDMIIIQPNRCIFVEIKTETGQQSDKQKEFQKTVEALGFEYWVIRSLEQLKNKLK